MWFNFIIIKVDEYRNKNYLFLYLNNLKIFLHASPIMQYYILSKYGNITGKIYSVEKQPWFFIIKMLVMYRVSTEINKCKGDVYELRPYKVNFGFLKSQWNKKKKRIDILKLRYRKVQNSEVLYYSVSWK